MKEYVIKHKNWQVPTFLTKEFSKKKTKYCIIIPVINEGERIKKQLGTMRNITNYADIIIADGGSTDNSLNEKVLSKNKVRTLLIKTGLGRLSAQMRMGLAYAAEEGYRGFIFIDGNNKDDPSAVKEFIKKLNEGYDHIQGSRFIEGGKAINTPLQRYIAIRFIHAPIISLFSGFKYTDTTNGFRAYSLKFVLDNKVALFRNIFSEYELHYYLSLRAPHLKFKTIEIPVTRTYPKKGKIPTKIGA